MSKHILRVFATNWGMWEAQDLDGRVWFTSTSRAAADEYVRAHGQQPEK